MTRRARNQVDSGTLAIVHAAGRSCRVLIASAKNGRPVIRDARTFSADSTAGLSAHLEEQRPERVIAVLPASSVVCRTCTLPIAEPDELDRALQLQADAHQGSAADGAAHRTATAVLPMSPGETTRAGIIVSWPGSAPTPTPPTDRPTTYIPDIGALAALLNGLRPAEPLLWLDRASGSVALGVSHAAGAVFRATREEAADAKEWAERVGRVLAETALNVGHGGGFVHSITSAYEQRITDVGPDNAALLLPDEIIESAMERLEGAERDESWWSQFGIAAGALLAATGELRALAALEATAEVERVSPIDRVLLTLSQPRAATMAIITAMVLIAFAPLAMSGLRLGILRYRHPDLEAQTEALGAADRRLAMYDALDRHAWSATKLLSDIVSNTPEGIELISIRLQQSDRRFAVMGTVIRHDKLTAPEVVARMQGLLRDSGLFGEIKLNIAEGNNSGQHDFELSAKVLAPHRRPQYEIAQDFANWTLAQRQARKPPPDLSAKSEPADDPGPNAAPGDGLRDEMTGSRDGEGPRRPSHLDGFGDGPADARKKSDTDERAIGRGAGPGAVPPPLDEATIHAMTTRDEILAHVTAVASAKNKIDAEAEPELFSRLSKEFDLLMARLRELH